MSLPRLIEPVSVTIARRVQTEALLDKNAREMIHGPRDKSEETFTLDGQVDWYNRPRSIQLEGGTRGEVTASITFLWQDLLDIVGGDRNRIFRPGDWVKSVDDYAPDEGLYIMAVQPLGHERSSGGPTLITYYLTDRAPTHHIGQV